MRNSSFLIRCKLLVIRFEKSSTQPPPYRQFFNNIADSVLNFVNSASSANQNMLSFAVSPRAVTAAVSSPALSFCSPSTQPTFKDHPAVKNTKFDISLEIPDFQYSTLDSDSPTPVPNAHGTGLVAPSIDELPSHFAGKSPIAVISLPNNYFRSGFSTYCRETTKLYCSSIGQYYFLVIPSFLYCTSALIHLYASFNFYIFIF